MTTYKANVYSCDNPKCSTQRPDREPDVEPAEGFHFRGILHVHPGGGDSFAHDTYACSVKCLAAALMASHRRYERGDDEG